MLEYKGYVLVGSAAGRRFSDTRCHLNLQSRPGDSRVLSRSGERLGAEANEGFIARGYYKGMYGGWPSWGRPLVPCEGPVDERVIKRVTYNLIRYQHSQKRRNGT